MRTLVRSEFYPTEPIHGYHVYSKEPCEAHIETPKGLKIMLAITNDRFYDARQKKWICAACATTLRIIP